MNPVLKRVRRLLNEAAGCIGMLAEVKTKCHLLKGKIKRAKRDGLYNEDSEAEACKSIEQMRSDLNTYSDRLKEIYKELKGYGVFSDMA